MSSSRIKLWIAADGMTALAEVAPGPTCGLDEVQAALRAAGVTFMLDSVAIEALAKQLADTNFQCRPTVVAQGQPAIPGRNGYFEPAFPMGIQPGHVDEHGTMDFFDRELLKPLAQGDYVGQLFEAVNGVVGHRVDGRELKVSAVRPSKLRAGPGITTAPDGRMHAGQAGVLVYSEEQTIDIAQQHEHRGDVDLHSGSLHMEGSIKVSGSVQRQFAVRATGNVDIQGHVEGGAVLAGGAVRICGRVRSGDSGLLCAEGDISMHHAEAAVVRCGGLLKLESAVNCELQASQVQVLRSVRGGSVQAETSVVVLEAGSRVETTTLLAAAVPIERPICDVKRAIDAAKQRRNQLQSAGLRDSDARAKGGKLGRANVAAEQDALARKVALATRRGELLAQASVHIIGTAHPGVTIQLGIHTLELAERVTGARFVYHPQQHKIGKEGPVS